MRPLLILISCMLVINSAGQVQTICYVTSASASTLATSLLSKPQLKKTTLKERLFRKIIERKIRKAADEDKSKRLVNRLGIISLVAGIAAPVILLPLGAIASYGLAQVLFIFSLLLMITAVITGIVSLTKRKKLADKTGTHNLPAILGIVFGSGLILLIVLIAATFRYNFS